MSLAAAAAEEDPVAGAPEIQLPADIDWKMLNKSKFFLLGAALFSGVSAALYPVVVLKTRLQVAAAAHLSSLRTASSILKLEGPRGLYRGFGTSLMGTIPARALYMTALEVTKSSVGTATVRLGLPETAAATMANAAGGLSSAMAAQLVWTPVDVISQRLMVQGGSTPGSSRYSNGIDAFRKIVRSDGVRGLYRGFGMSILTYAPSNAVWWASYSVAQRLAWASLRSSRGDGGGSGYRPDAKTVVGVQGVSAALAGGISAVVTMPLDTIKTRLQVLEEGAGEGRRGAAPTIVETAKKLVGEGGWRACYRGLGPRWASMSMSATTMITTYELLKRLSAKKYE